MINNYMREFLNNNSWDSNPILKEDRIKNMEVKTKTGFRRWSGKHWMYYISTFCSNCNKTIMIPKLGLKKYKTHFCPDTYYECRDEFKIKQNDQKLFQILDNPTDPNFIYLIGLISTDGSIKWPKCTETALNYACTIELKISDRQLLTNIQNRFGGKLYFPKNKRSIIWKVNSKKFILYLKEIVNLTNNKSFTLDVEKWFNKLSNINKTHFLRGVIDGDGSIYKSGNYWGFSICTYSEKFKELLKQYFNPYNVKTDEHKIVLNGKNAIQPLKDIMTNEYLHLERKYNKFQQLLIETA